MTQNIMALLATATLGLSGPALPPSAAISSGNTVTIVATNVDAEPVFEPGPPNSVTIHFRNTGDVAVTELVFTVQGAGLIPTTIDDVGNFPKGDYVHTFYNLGDIYQGTVALRSVSYLDGSEWTAPITRSRRQAGSLTAH
jgi:hypothetical protein